MRLLLIPLLLILPACAFVEGLAGAAARDEVISCLEPELEAWIKSEWEEHKAKQSAADAP